ncbi:uncharacterized protein LOC125563191 [Nematostella vectensis]|uniref:uncharacterized protein LOC125563191 n=1 Tax=Nematostella vectensis TaxID=45351 RepID=UPI00207738E1|nr:uncharacterized protein LOC125563191 [Nematostella vectensis]
MALCALGLVTGDSALAGAALGELMKLGGEGNKDLHYEICYLFSRFYTLQGDPRLGLRHIVKAVHRHPDRAELWDQLAAFIVQVCPDDLQAASRCAEGTVKLDPVTDGTNRTLYPASILGSGTLPTTGDPPLDASNLTSRSTYALRASQKALRMYPGHVTNWAVFVCCNCQWYCSRERD